MKTRSKSYRDTEKYQYKDKNGKRHPLNFTFSAIVWENYKKAVAGPRILAQRVYNLREIDVIQMIMLETKRWHKFKQIVKKVEKLNILPYNDHYPDSLHLSVEVLDGVNWLILKGGEINAYYHTRASRNHCKLSSKRFEKQFREGKLRYCNPDGYYRKGVERANKKRDNKLTERPECA